MIQPAVSCKQTSNRLSNPFDNRLDNRLYRVNGALEMQMILENDVRDALRQVLDPQSEHIIRPFKFI